MTTTPWIVIYYGGSYGIAHESEELGCLEIVCVGMTDKNALLMCDKLNRKLPPPAPHRD